MPNKKKPASNSQQWLAHALGYVYAFAHMPEAEGRNEAMNSFGTKAINDARAALNEGQEAKINPEALKNKLGEVAENPEMQKATEEFFIVMAQALLEGHDTIAKSFLNAAHTKELVAR